MQTVLGPFIVPGIAGVATTFTANDCAAVPPQALLAVTITLPPVVPSVACMLLVVELPDHPLGKVQL